MRNLEQLPVAEIAAVLGLTEGPSRSATSAPCSVAAILEVSP